MIEQEYRKPDRREPWLAVAVVSLAVFISYGLFLNRLGFYWDDWAALHIGKVGGVQGLFDWLWMRRGFLSCSPSALYALFDSNPVGWHASIFCARWVIGLFALWGLRGLLPGQPLATTAAALLIAIYPGQEHTPLGVIGWNLSIPLAFSAISFASTVRSFTAKSRNARYMLVGLASLTGLLSCVVYEIMISFEALRLGIIYYFTRQETSSATKRETAKQSAWRWLPYFLLLLPYVIWRYLLFKSTKTVNQPDYILRWIFDHPLEYLYSLFHNFYQALSQSLILVWSITLRHRMGEVSDFTVLWCYALGLLTAGAFWLYYRWSQKRQETGEAYAEKASLIANGAIFMALGLPLSGPLDGTVNAIKIICTTLTISAVVLLAPLWIKRGNYKESLKWWASPANPFWWGAAAMFLGLMPARYIFLTPIHFLLLSLAVVVGICFCLWMGLRLTARYGLASGKKALWIKVSLVLGTLGLVAGLAIPVAALRVIIPTAAGGRYTVAAIIGLGVLASGILFASLRRKGAVIVLCGLITLSVSYHAMNQWLHVEIWQTYLSLAWQMHWRAPWLQKDTLIAMQPLFPQAPHTYEVLGFASHLYPRAGVLGHRLYTGERGDEFAEAIRTGGKQLGGMGGFLLDMEADKTLLVVVPPRGQGCLRILGPETEAPPYVAQRTRDLARFSHPERIVAPPRPRTLAKETFGSEPAHGWCYYFQKADLARQRGEWNQVAELGRKAIARGLAPAEPSEWMPFVEGFARTGNKDKARELANLVFSKVTPAWSLPPRQQTFVNELREGK